MGSEQVSDVVVGSGPLMVRDNRAW
jgi:hypothetical protein